MGKKKIIASSITNDNQIKNSHKTEYEENLSIGFSHFCLSSVCIKGEFNNHFKDDRHYLEISSDFLGKILPKITSHKYREICEGSAEGGIIHFHMIDEKHQELVVKVLKEYNFTKQMIDQITEGKFFEFSACLGHLNAARIVCYKSSANVLQALFLDTNHHIYINNKYIKESMQYKNSITSRF